MASERPTERGFTRRGFLQTVGVGAPSVALVLEGVPARATAPPPSDTGRSTPIDLGRFFNCSSRDFGAHEEARQAGGESAKDGFVRAPFGRQSLRGLPFELGPGGLDARQWVRLSTRKGPATIPRIEVPLDQPARFVCLAAFCDWSAPRVDRGGEEAPDALGQTLAEAVLLYADGTEKRLPLRRRFEVFMPAYPWGNLAFASVAHRSDAPRKLSDPLPSGLDWGNLQTVVTDSAYAEDGSATLWVSALPNPEPERPLRALRLEAAGEDAFLLCGLTLFQGRESPLRYERLRLYRFTLPEPAGDAARWRLDVDLGVVARSFLPTGFDPETWLGAKDAGLGGRAQPLVEGRHLYAEVTASPEATLALVDTRTNRRFEFDLGRVEAGRELEARSGHAHVELLEPRKTWVHGRVVDEATGRPTPARLAFRSREGRYIPPYGHATEINDGWFQDYGADVKLMDTSFAYVDGTFQVELPVGEVYVELTKGFEYAPVRRRLRIEPGQREVEIGIARFADLRSRGWVTADTHVHFLSPSTAVLEGQAEGVNLVSLLAAQWADLFTNVGDLAHGALVSRDGETIVQVNTENRQHLLGHLGLVGGEGAPVYPMSASGPGESYLGDPLWTSLADWTDRQHERKGLVVAVHFPFPTAEIAADIALGKIDALELFPYGQSFATERFRDWYRYLDCGYRLPAVGGTDKMGAYMPVGANRTYVHLGGEPFTFESWAAAVRRGRTFMTTGPLLLFEVEGRMPGDEITLGTGGAHLAARVEARSFVPFHRLEVVANGRVVASRDEAAGTREMTLEEAVPVSGPGWLAARCVSRFGPTTAWGLGIQAHTSPVYLAVPGRELVSPHTIAYMLTLVEGTEAWVENLAVRPDPERLARVRATLRSARERLHQRLHAHGFAH
jgi:hypothetical protein